MMNYALLLMAFLGLVVNVAKKYDSGLKLARAGNARFNPAIYLQKDWLSLVVAVVAIVVSVYNIQEIQAAIPEKYRWILKLLFVAIGYSGSDVLIYLLNTSRKLTLQVIDRKTNVLDYEMNGRAENFKSTI